MKPSLFIKKYLTSALMRDFCHDQPQYDDPLHVKSHAQGYFSSWGELNKDKIFYVIWLDLGSGFFSNFSAVMCHLKIADSLGMAPVVDFANFSTLYNVKTPINNSFNAWEYYFSPVSQYTLDEVYSSKNVFFGSGRYPHGMTFNITEIDGLYESVYKKYVFLKENVEVQISRFSELVRGRVLGIHFRGKEQNLASNHSFGPTPSQMIRYTDEILGQFGIEKIFLVTEDQAYLDLYLKQYGSMVGCTESFRSYKTNSYNLNPRENHRYLLGLEILVDAILLSKCSGLLCGDSNVSEFARFANNKQYEFVYKIDNGTNVRNPILALYMYSIRKKLPAFLAGLKDEVTISKF